MKAHLKFLYSAALLAAALVTAIVPADASAAIEPGTYKIFTGATGFSKVVDVGSPSGCRPPVASPHYPEK
jgi:hypothetical protein